MIMQLNIAQCMFPWIQHGDSSAVSNPPQGLLEIFKASKQGEGSGSSFSAL